MRTPLLALLPALVVCAASAQAPRRSSVVSDLEAKVALESAVEKRLQDVLRRMLGADDVVVVVNADLLSDIEKPDNEILPGVSAKEVPGGAAALSMPVSLVRRVSVTVFLDQDASDESVALVKKTAQSMISLRPERGDTLAVERMNFHKTPAPEAPREGLLTPRTIWSAAWLLAAALGLLLVVRRFLEPLLGVLRDAADALRAARPAAGPGAIDPPLSAREEAGRVALEPLRSHAAASENERVLPFSFIQERDVPTLVTLLENQSAQMTAVIVHFLPPAFASRALDAMPEARRKEIVSQMATPMLLDMTHVQAVESTIRASIDCLIGGEDKIADILTESPVRLQNELLAALRSADEALGERLSRRLVVLDDISRLDDSGLTTLSRSVPLKSMAAALKTAPDLAAHVLGRLKTGLGEWLKQEIDLAGDLPERAREAEVRRVVTALTALVRDGRVALRKGELPAGPPAPTNGNGADHADGAQ
jgi:hypothetical protein